MFFELTGIQAKHLSLTRWFAEFEVVNQISLHYGGVVQVVQAPGDWSKAHRVDMRKILQEFESQLKLELALVMDIGAHLVRLCYLSEGDGIISPRVYDDIMHVDGVLNKPGDFATP
jgi:hypothetical protein